jgi:hypothetical protein
VASVIGFLKGKSAIAIARLCGKERNFSGAHFWARGYAVSTVGFELEQVRQYIREQETADGNSGQFCMVAGSPSARNKKTREIEMIGAGSAGRGDG